MDVGRRARGAGGAGAPQEVDDAGQPTAPALPPFSQQGEGVTARLVRHVAEGHSGAALEAVEAGADCDAALPAGRGPGPGGGDCYLAK